MDPLKTVSLPQTRIDVPTVEEGYVSPTLPAPSSFAEPAWVIIPDYSTERPLECRIATARGATLPGPGDRCLVLHGEQPILIWWEAGYTGLLEKGRSEPMVAGEIAIAAPAVTATNVILYSVEGSSTVGTAISERKPGVGFAVKGGAGSTDRVNWAVYA